MKCIKNKKDGTISRVEDEVAAKKVAKGEAAYCPKAEWKKIRDGK